MTTTARAARLDALRREGGPKAEIPEGYKPPETAPMNGSLIQTPRGVIMRWTAYKPDSESAIAGIEGRWQVWRSGLGVWTNASTAPPCWRGYNQAPKKRRA